MAELTTPSMNRRAPASGDDGRGPGFEAYVTVMVIVTVAAITLRFLSRSIALPQRSYQIQRRLWWDDWLALAAVPFILGLLASAYVLLHFGLGRHAGSQPPPNLLVIRNTLFAGYLLYYVSLYLTKASALLFFSRVFPKRIAGQRFTILLWTTHGLNTAWLIGTIIGSFLACHPVDKPWSPSVSAGCDPCALWHGSAISSALIDLIILVLPLPMIWSLQTSRARKVGMTIVFVLGYFVIVVSIGRLITIMKSAEIFTSDVSYKVVTVLYWQCAEAPISLLSICLPAMLTLGRRIYTSYFSPLASRVSEIISSRGSSRTSKAKSGDFTGATDGRHRYVHLHPEKDPNRVRNPTAYDTESIPSVDSRTQIIRDMSAIQYPYTARVHGGESRGAMQSYVPDQAIRVDSDITIRHDGY